MYGLNFYVLTYPNQNKFYMYLSLNFKYVRKHIQVVWIEDIMLGSKTLETNVLEFHFIFVSKP